MRIKDHQEGRATAATKKGVRLDNIDKQDKKTSMVWNKTKKREVSKWERFGRLDWTRTPSRRMPHGLTGAFSVIIGLHLIVDALSGRITRHEPLPSSVSVLDDHNDGAPSRSLQALIPIEIVSFVVCSMANAISGYKMSRFAWKETQGLFRRCAILQICLSYYILRFTPHFTLLFNNLLLSNDNDPSFCSGTKEIMPFLLHLLDIVTAIVTILSCLSFLQVAFDFWTRPDAAKEIAAAIAGGTFGILLLSSYPLQLAIFGQQNWWEPIHQVRYPHQAIAMVGYIYIPATVTFSLMLFGATLYQRGILNEQTFGVASFWVIAICLISTVGSQEVHLPDVSTQRLYMPVIDPDAGTFEAAFVHSLDFSRYARLSLTSIFGMEFPTTKG